MKNNEEFKITYSAPSAKERLQIESIRNQYLPQTEREKKNNLLQKLHRRTQNLPKIVCAIMIIVGILVFGLGFTTILEWSQIVWGTIISAIGIAIFSLSFYVLKLMKKFLINKYSEKILSLSNELLGEDSENKKTNEQILNLKNEKVETNQTLSKKPN